MPRVRLPRRNAGAIAKDILLTLAGMAGLLSIVGFVLTLVFSLSIVIVLTGSMAPGLPTGSAIVVEEDVPAADLVIGDIVTVARAGYDLPITHRIVGIEEIPGEASARALTLQGDANATVDRDTYIVQTVQRAVIGFPGFGFALRTMQSPLFIGVTTLLITLAIVWAFWPSRPEREAAVIDSRQESINSTRERQETW
ncbi:signal peptidase I [Cryobacterium levicorallinum]|uniref:Signal peptidase I n=1 Tax=Cryobacterium levicorallinum TaxID=995038 RepID=A0A1I2YP48_9MICO|nr:signal peptidase I [Cryobacterium levicorallinum]GEP27626.1 hypothetical protein CLE01_22240 [Cryobacterium levicorallinum]SFH27413.1 signal peptidase, endoplasmic reticulum-type [Cryobacterium levicorallinum]